MGERHPPRSVACHISIVLPTQYPQFERWDQYISYYMQIQPPFCSKMRTTRLYRTLLIASRQSTLDGGGGSCNAWASSEETALLQLMTMMSAIHWKIAAMSVAVVRTRTTWGVKARAAV